MTILSTLRSAAAFASGERRFLLQSFAVWSLWTLLVMALWAAAAAFGDGFSLAVASISAFSATAAFCARLSLASFRRSLPRAFAVLLRAAAADSAYPASWSRLLRAAAAFLAFAARTAAPCFIFFWVENWLGSSTFATLVTGTASIFSQIAWLLFFGPDACSALPASSVLSSLSPSALCSVGRAGAAVLCGALLLVGPASGLFSAARRSNARRIAAAWSETCAERAARDEAKALFDASAPGRRAPPPSL